MNYIVGLSLFLTLIAFRLLPLFLIVWLFVELLT